MNTNAKLKDLLRRARADGSLRKDLLENARFVKSAFGWLALFWVLFLSVLIAFKVSPWFSSLSILVLVSLIVAVMVYDKFADRVAMLESMEAEPRLAGSTTSAGISAVEQPRPRITSVSAKYL
jgi:uncharacterized membrane protein YoaK (UPF0700 family)